MIDGAAALQFVGDEAVLGVEEQDAELLDLFARHYRVQVGHQLVPVAEKRLVLQFLAGEADSGVVDQF